MGTFWHDIECASFWHSVEFSYLTLGALVALLTNYHKLIHGFDSKDIVSSTFHTSSGDCYRLLPRVVECSNGPSAPLTNQSRTGS